MLPPHARRVVQKAACTYETDEPTQTSSPQRMPADGIPAEGEDGVHLVPLLGDQQEVPVANHPNEKYPLAKTDAPSSRVADFPCVRGSLQVPRYRFAKIGKACDRAEGDSGGHTVVGDVWLRCRHAATVVRKVEIGRIW